jgi:cyclic pyranopterin phosphate synthase
VSDASERDRPDAPAPLSHVDAAGAARMVDVGAKPETERLARAGGAIRMSQAAFDALSGNALAKGDALTVARVAGVMGAKRTADLIPLCHPLALSDVQVSMELDPALPGVRIEATARTIGRTGVEMEAMTAVSVALLTIYDMAKAVDKSMVLLDIALIEKRGGKSGDWGRP